MSARWRAARIGWLVLMLSAAACVSGGVDQTGSGGGGGGGGGGGTGGEEVATWLAGSVAMNGDEAFTYADVRLVFSENPTGVSISAVAGNTTYVWSGAYTRNGDVISTEALPEASAGSDDVMALDAQLSGSNLIGTLTESYPKAGRTYEVSGNFTADKSS